MPDSEPSLIEYIDGTIFIGGYKSRPFQIDFYQANWAWAKKQNSYRSYDFQREALGLDINLTNTLFLKAPVLKWVARTETKLVA